jgi:hypothetical protein
MITARHVLVLLALATAPFVSSLLAQAPSSNSDEEYRKSMESYRVTAAANERDRMIDKRIRAVVLATGIVIIGSLVVFVVIPSRRDQKRQLALTLENQKALADIRALIEKRRN